MVKKGYKQTEIGVIPEDWEVKPLKVVAPLQRGFDLPYSSIKDGIYPVVFSNGIGAYHSSYMVKGPGVVMGRSGTIGKIHYVKSDYWPHNTTLWVTDFHNNDPLFASYLFKTIPWNLYNSGSGVPTLNRNDVQDYLVAIPSPKEQTEIAAILSDVDTLINSLKRQIVKKKAIKQGAMQELLTGKRRLPGFSGEWRYFNLMKNSKVKARIGWQGLKKSEYLDSGYALLVTGTDFDDGRVLWNGCHYVTRSRYEQDRNIQLQNNDILITKDGSLGKAALVQGLTKPATLNSGIFVIRPLQDAYDPVFVYQILSSFVFKNFLDRLSAGSTIIHLYQKDVGKFEFLLPPTIAEQKAIAEALSEMDADIAALENKLTKYRQVKQGMMQQLLTGKIRLKNDVEDLVQAGQANAVKTLPARTAHNRQFDDAVSIAAIVDTFYSDKYPVGRVKVQKLLYLLHRHQAVSVSDFKKKAAGPYADTVRYKGGEPIAKKNKYIVSENGKQGTRYSRGENMAQALNYVERWGMQSDLQWLKENFLHTGRNDLELFATVDMAICDLNEAGVPISVASIKDLIASSKEWKPKLSKTYFSDRDIARAIKKCTELFN